MSELSSGGVMEAVMSSESDVRAAMQAAGVGSGASVAAINGPAATVVSGDADAVSKVIAALGDGVKRRPLPVSHAFHSARMEPMVERLREAAGAARLRDRDLPDGGVLSLSGYSKPIGIFLVFLKYSWYFLHILSIS